MRIETELARRGGVARWRDLVDAGAPGANLTRAVREGAIERPHRGCYALPGTSRPTVLAGIFRAQLTCVTWCASVGLPVEVAPTLAHLAVPVTRALGAPRLRPAAEVTLHRIGRVPDGFPWIHADVAALCTTPIQQLAIIDAALNTGAITRADVAQLRYGDSARRAWIRQQADGRAQSLGETYARVALRNAGLSVVPQARIGTIGVVDLLVGRRVVVEIDGYAFHGSKEAFAADRSRDRALVLAGYVPLRFAHTDVVADLAEVVAEVGAVVWRLGLAPRKVRTKRDADTPSAQPMWWR